MQLAPGTETQLTVEVEAKGIDVPKRREGSFATSVDILSEVQGWNIPAGGDYECDYEFDDDDIRREIEGPDDEPAGFMEHLIPGNSE